MTDGLIVFLASLGAPTAPAMAGHRPWPRWQVEREGWLQLADRLFSADWSLLSLWGEAAEVHAALRDEADGGIAVVSLPCPTGRFPSLAAVRPGAIRLERAVQDLTGLLSEGLDDSRPWLDHDSWTQRFPLATVPAAPLPTPQPYVFLPSEGPGLHVIPVGPVHAGIIEPGHFRFTCHGETVVRLEERLGYLHKGTERLMRGKLPDDAARLAGRVSGDSTVAGTWSFCLALESALGLTVPRRALLLRALMAELERIANHINDVGAIANDAAFPFLQAECTTLREQVLRAADLAFGHRFMMDRVVPGGVAIDLKPGGVAALQALLALFRRELPRVAALYEQTASLQDRTVGTGIVSPELVWRFAAGGPVGRASMRAFDARKAVGYAPYDELEFEIPVLADGDVNARVQVRLAELTESLSMIGQILRRLEPGPARILLPDVSEAVEGMALVEGFRGDVLTWIRLGKGGRIERAHVRDPSWFQWPLLEVAIDGCIVADFPLCNKSFNCSYSGHDL
jgi:Ni,Fe-hydrogenase III large subunit